MRKTCLFIKMRQFLYFTSILLALMCISPAVYTKSTESAALPTNISRYDNYRIYQVELDTERHVELFQQLEQQSDSCSFMGHARHEKQKLSILVAAHKVADFVDLLNTYKVKHRVLNYNLQANIDRNFNSVLPKNTPPQKFDWQHYFHLETIYAWMKNLAAQHSHVLTLLDMGKSELGLPIKGLKLAHSKTNKAIFIESGIHAREWIAPATATYLMHALLTSTDARIQRLATSYNWIMFPVINPDGYKYTFESDRMWRKNRQIYGICRGVDLNRNFPLHWNTTGTSGDPCRYDYSGPAAASETETQMLMKFVAEHKDTEQIRTYLALHSYSQLIMFPYSSTPQRVDNYEDLSAIGKKASESIQKLTGRIYKSGSIYETIYPSSGGSKDWVYGSMKIPVTFTFELRGPPDSNDMFILPAEEIEPTAQETLAAIAVIVEEAQARGYYK